VYGHLDYNNGILDTAFVRLFESVMTIRFFIVKVLKAQKRYLDELVRELNFDFFTSRSNYTNNITSARASSSDELGDDDNENEVDLTA